MQFADVTASQAKLKASAALGEIPSEMLLDVGSTPTISTICSKGQDRKVLFF